VLFWMAAAITVIVMANAGPVGWDARGYWKAIQTVHRGSDPYAQDLEALQTYHNRLAANPGERQPFVYVYSPTTLPLLRFLGILPGWLLGLLYGVAVAIGALLELWAGFQLADEGERRFLAFALPALMFFPGLITDDVILSGNVAFPLYGAILAAATLGWRRNRWFPYYIAVLVASVFKTPFLVLLAFPVLIDRRQRIPSGLTAGTGVLLFAAQMRVCPVLFREYLSSLRLVFDWLRDFGYGPAGTLGKALESLGLQSMFATTIVHLAFAGAMAIVLFSLARHVRRENLPQQTWIPLALVGTFLLNPRLMKYDMAAITIPMLLIAWRGFRFAFQGSAPENPGHGWKATHTLIFACAAAFLAPNLMTIFGPAWWPVELLTMLAVFGIGVWSLLPRQVEAQPRTLSIGNDLIEIDLAIPEEIAYPVQ
jgi:hypothetical protein